MPGADSEKALFARTPGDGGAVLGVRHCDHAFEKRLGRQGRCVFGCPCAIVLCPATPMPLWSI